ncbi:hypothetical protein ACHAWO_013987 [Cyclotella atomus]|uniref:ABC transporter domain-containing protein n=1 Tax=Cyclotella atomus TaxID=382360 RepID=A0ABD3MRP4_9STRA
MELVVEYSIFWTVCLEYHNRLHRAMKTKMAQSNPINEFEDVSFSYPSRPKSEPNTTTALVGSSGSGKNTIVALLQRFYDINEGRIAINGLRKHIGFDREVTQEELEAASKDSHAHEFISRMSEGYETLSALDAESEHLVQQAIDKAVRGRTVIIVAHRLSTIRQADQIVVMHNHRVADVGQRVECNDP